MQWKLYWKSQFSRQTTANRYNFFKSQSINMIFRLKITYLDSIRTSSTKVLERNLAPLYSIIVLEHSLRTTVSASQSAIIHSSIIWFPLSINPTLIRPWSSHVNKSFRSNVSCPTFQINHIITIHGARTIMRLHVVPISVVRRRRCNGDGISLAPTSHRRTNVVIGDDLRAFATVKCSS